MAKLNRERRLIERRLQKQAKKQARREASATQPESSAPDTQGADEHQPSDAVRTNAHISGPGQPS